MIDDIDRAYKLYNDSHVKPQACTPALANGDLAQIDDHELIKAVLVGQTDSFSELYNRYHRQIFSYVLGMCNHHIQTAEDVCSQIWIKAYSKLPQYNFRTKFFSWIYTIARNTVIDTARKLKRIPHMIELNEAIIPVSMHVDDTQYSKEQTTQILSSLQPKDKEILILRYIEEYQPKQISAMLKISVTSVSARITRAKQRAQKIHTAYEPNQ